MRRLKRKNFFPTESLSNERSSQNYSEEDINKGDQNQHVDLANVEQDCIELLKILDTKISDLTGEHKERYQRIVSIAQMLYNTHFYPHFFERISKHCATITNVKAGTVGGYLCGCLANKNFSDSTCAPICVEGLPLPQNLENLKHCNHAVIFAKYESTGYTFSVIRAGKTPIEYDPAYLFIDCEDLHSCKGFTASEIQQLFSLGVQTLQVYGQKISKTGTTYPPLYSNPIKPSNLKTRTSSGSNSSYISTTTIIIIIIVILILLLLFYCYQRWY